jgi:hypothetical protein
MRKRDRVYFETALLNILEEPARLKASRQQVALSALKHAQTIGAVSGSLFADYFRIADHPGVDRIGQRIAFTGT